jgi:two-component system sensor histidine kinase BaeS
LLLVAAWVARWAAGQVVRPLLQIQTATEQIAQGKLDTRLQTQRSDELGDTMRNINRMTEGLQQLEASRRQWIANMSHELRTPLTVLRGEIDALVDGIHSASPTTLQSLREEVLKLNALVDDLHLLAMADLNALPCYFETLDAVALLQSITQRFALRAQQAGLTLQFETTWPSLSVRWDAKRIEQLLGNLLDNSLRYTHAPGQVVLRLHCPNQLAVIDLEDSAPGLSPAELSRVFEPLYRAEASRSRDAGGSGLGLAIAEQIAKAHHGHLSASAAELGGVLFQIQLPLQADQAA